MHIVVLTFLFFYKIFFDTCKNIEYCLIKIMVTRIKKKRSENQNG
ncbi:hypothetical protein QE441_000736 [Chryseobacterium sp. SORGH_AS909]|uniref:Uncharacterized protein n=1 Tax=Chryseobacterium camelliae TaxID=1265445 RepID=A0ABU0TKJ5_9FLAO|nr:hypothetical protein [Chryseobacterium camelliae]MDQ1101499.1 hypothetical protein [Chryseobacterium sp. SORGH_AS_1048]MDR6084942.1 hypothetical protein [Chryseobacterium sp. SORGH_AS_0909]MDR6129295.1 hypothetical protein [Chryseobacterium sp. SORGH_AS_1175]MDT3408575.1 hypothetical protein [Pseudacidovorax intermedius]